MILSGVNGRAFDRPNSNRIASGEIRPRFPWPVMAILTLDNHFHGVPNLRVINSSDDLR